MKTHRVVRRSSADAVRVTADNIGEVAEWCGGEPTVVFLGTEVDRIRLEGSTVRVGDYVVFEDGKFHGVTAAAYAVLYQPEGE